MAITDENLLGRFLRDRRAKLDPTAFGIPPTRRRTPGLRREEVAQRANISATWYTWLEQGRGGAPSADVLNRIAGALMLTEIEREHLFLIGLGRPPDVELMAPASVTPRLQRVLDALADCPALIKTYTWDVVAWNHAATRILTDYAAMPPDRRNVLKMMFTNEQARAAQADWESVARMVVATFRADVARAGATSETEALVDELCATSPEFSALWAENDVEARGGGVKRLNHPAVGALELELSTFAVAGRPDLDMLVYCPATPENAAKMRTLLTPEVERPRTALPAAGWARLRG